MVTKQKILIVDDDENIAELISLYLTKECFETKIVYDGESALDALPSFKPNLILLDLMLPGIDGYQVCREIRKNNNTPIIMLSAKGEMKGQVLMAFSYANALNVASRMMMGMPVTELDDMATSAISELGNMIMGNAATIFSTKGIVIDITPPTVCQGSMTITQTYAQNICVPIQAGDGLSLELDIAIKTE